MKIISIRSKHVINCYHLLFLFLILLSITAVSQSVASEKQNETYIGWGYGVGVYLNNSFPILIQIEILPGNGNLTIEGVEGDALFYLSNKIAIYQALWDEGRDPWKYDYILRVFPYYNTTFLSGSSLSLTTYITTISALEKKSLPEKIMFTGTLNPDSTIGFVSDVKLKAIAAQTNKFKTFYYPILQNYTYQITTQSVHIGPYSFSKRVIKSDVVNFENITIPLVQVRGGQETYNILHNKEFIFQSSYAGLLVTSNEILGNNTIVLTRYLDGLEKNFYNRLEETTKILSSLILTTGYGDMTSTINTYISQAKGYFSLYQELVKRNYLFLSLEILSKAYSEINKAYFLAKILSEPTNKAVNEIYYDISRETQLVGKILNQTKKELTLEKALVLGYAASTYNDALQRLVRLNLGLQALSAGFGGREGIGLSLSKDIEEIYYKLKIAEALGLLSLKINDNRTINATQLVYKLIQYGNELQRYAMEYSLATDVYSEIINRGRAYLWKALSLNKKDPLSLLASIDYAITSISYFQLYFALHPGISEVWEVRFPMILTTIRNYDNHLDKRPLLTEYFLEKSVLYNTTDSKILWLERAIGYQKAALSSPVIGIINSSDGEITSIMNNTTIGAISEKESSLLLPIIMILLAGIFLLIEFIVYNKIFIIEHRE